MPPAADGCSTGIPFWAILLYKAMVVDMTGMLEGTEIDIDTVMSSNSRPGERLCIPMHLLASPLCFLENQMNEGRQHMGRPP